MKEYKDKEERTFLYIYDDSIDVDSESIWTTGYNEAVEELKQFVEEDEL